LIAPPLSSEQQFKNCKTLLNSSSPTYGWGGAIFLWTAQTLSSSNFQLTSLTFVGCEAVNKAGHHIHIQSPSTNATGSAIKNGNLLTVSGGTDLYTTSNYNFEYMGIDTSNAGTGTIDPQYHLDLFRQHYISNVPNPCYIDASTIGVDQPDCGGLRYKCKTIAYAIDRNTLPPSGTAPSKDINFVIILMTIPSSDNNLQISLPTTYNNYITIQSNGYIAGGTGYTKYKITSSSQTNSLFQVTGAGRVELLGLQFDNLKTSSPAASAPFISVQNGGTSIQSMIIDSCEFALAGSSNLAHSIISVNGGKISIQKTTFVNYKFDGVMSAIVIQSSSSVISVVELVNVDFTDITQSGTGNGACINCILNSGSSLKTNDSSTFTRCKANSGFGGGIYSTIIDGQIELNKVTFSSCESKSGGAVYSTVSGSGQLSITNQCQFTSCTSSDGNGGGVYASLSSISDSGGIYISGTSSTFTSCTSPISSGLGGAIYLDLSIGTESKYDLTGAS
ncbi:MAG: hypothetical protein EZS28_042573, partial [Streblomastix strix]